MVFMFVDMICHSLLVGELAVSELPFVKRVAQASYPSRQAGCLSHYFDCHLSNHGIKAQ